MYPPGEDLSQLSPSSINTSAAEEFAGAALAPANAPVRRSNTGGTDTASSELADLGSWNRGSAAPTTWQTPETWQTPATWQTPSLSTRSAEGGMVSYSEAASPAAAAAAAAAPAETAQPEAGRVNSLRQRLWRGPRTSQWGTHVDGEQEQIVGCCHARCPMTRRFYHVFDITDIWKFYKELRHHHRTVSTDNLDARSGWRYALGFFRARHSLRRAEGVGAPPNVQDAPLRDHLASGLTPEDFTQLQDRPQSLQDRPHS